MFEQNKFEELTKHTKNCQGEVRISDLILESIKQDQEMKDGNILKEKKQQEYENQISMQQQIFDKYTKNI